nr:recombinase family protein [uncultured Sphingomonas sp.]
MHAIIYARYSSGAQGQGTSIERQLGNGRKEAARLELSVEEEVFDKALSAFKGSNRKGDAGLAVLERRAAAGDLRGKTIIVEFLDRFSRQGFEEALPLVLTFVRNGVRIVSYRDDIKIEPDARLEIDMLLRLLIKSEMARTESENKAKRVRDAKAINREKARTEGRIMTKNGPKWLKIENGKWAEDEERVALVRRIFAMSDGGMGTIAIAKALNSERIPKWTNMGKDSRGWHHSFIVRMLSSRSVIGECQPCSTVDGKRVPCGEPIQGYFPAVVDAALFERVQQNAVHRMERSRGNNKTERVGNLVSGLVTCSCCNAPMTYAMKGRAGSTKTVNGTVYVRTVDDSHFKCSNVLRKVKTCENRRSWSYQRFESALLDSVLHLAMDDAAFANRGEVARLANLIAQRERERDLLTRRAERLFEEYADSGLELARNGARRASIAAKELGGSIEALRQQRGQASGRTGSAAHIARIADIRQQMERGSYEERIAIRRKVQISLRALIECVTFSEVTATINFKAGAGLVMVKRDGSFHHVNMLHPLRQPPQGAEAIFRRLTSCKAA